MADLDAVIGLGVDGVRVIRVQKTPRFRTERDETDTPTSIRRGKWATPAWRYEVEVVFETEDAQEAFLDLFTAGQGPATAHTWTDPRAGGLLDVYFVDDELPEEWLYGEVTRYVFALETNG